MVAMKKALTVTLIIALVIGTTQVIGSTALARRKTRNPRSIKTYPAPEPAPAPAPVPEPAPALENNILFSDNFDRADQIIDDAGNRVDPLGKWSVTAGVFSVKSMHGYTNNSVFRVVTERSDFSNLTFKADLMKKDLGVEAFDGLQLFFRYKDPDNLYVAGLRNDNQIQLKKKVNGIYTTLGQASIESNKLGYWYHMIIVVNGNHLEVYVDGKKYIDKYDSSLTSGKVGIRTDNIEAYFDNVEVLTNN